MLIVATFEKTQIEEFSLMSYNELKYRFILFQKSNIRCKKKFEFYENQYNVSGLYKRVRAFKLCDCQLSNIIALSMLVTCLLYTTPSPRDRG